MVFSRKTFKWWLILLPDVALFYFGLYLAVRVRYPEGLNPEAWSAHLNAFSLIFLAWLLVLFIHGLFESNSFRRYSALVFNLASAMVVNSLVAIVYFYFQPGLILTPRRFLFIVVAINFILVLAWHLLVKYFLQRRMVEQIYLFSFNRELDELEKEIQTHGYLGYRLMGHLDELALAGREFPPDIGIVLPDNLPTRPEIMEKLYRLRKNGVAFYNHRRFFEDLARRIYVSQIDESWFLENINYQEKRLYNLAKRALDLLFGVLGLPFFIASWPICALLIKSTSAGPVLFVQERVGKHGRIFKVYKYRTMSGGPTNSWTSPNDPRITKIGRFLRKSRIDEWPQFLNLLKGNMSLVGPRPEQPHIVEDLKKQIPFYDERHLVKPGLTGWAQLNVYAGSVEESRLKLQYDLYYIKHRGLLLDAEIILKTLYYIFTWSGR